ATNGPPARPLPAWIARATTSFPVPVSPSMTTVESSGATRPISSSRRAMAGDAPTSAGGGGAGRGAGHGARAAAARRAEATATAEPGGDRDADRLLVVDDQDREGQAHPSIIRLLERARPGEARLPARRVLRAEVGPVARDDRVARVGTRAVRVEDVRREAVVV